MTIQIRPVETINAGREIEQLQTAIWGKGTPIVPDLLFLTAAHSKGCVLLAWDGDQAVGFCLSIVSFSGDHATDPTCRLRHHSYVVGVIPAYQGQGIGERLKWAQRDFVLAQGIEYITWTYDPLEINNGRLNIHRLGAVCAIYNRNVYGLRRDALNQGLPSDRFQVDWWLASERVLAHKDKTYSHPARSALQTDGAILINGPVSDLDFETLKTISQILVAVPTDFQQIKRTDLALARRWREHTRSIFESAFDSGFRVVDLLREETLSYYLLENSFGLIVESG